MLELAVDDRMATVTMDRPPVNAWDGHALDVFDDVLGTLEDADDVDLAVVRSAGRHFSAGADIAMMAAAVERRDLTSQGDFAARIQQLFTRWDELPMPTVAVLRGVAAGGGLELALASDVRIAADDSRLGLPEGKLGLLPAGGGTQRLTRLVGRGLAVRMMLTGELVSGRRALDIGLVEWCFPSAHLDEEAARVVAQITANASEAQRLLKRCTATAESPEGYALETSGQRHLYTTTDTQRRIDDFVTQRSNT